MKKNNKPVVRKVRPLGNLEDTYYTYSNWETKFIDGIEYVYVVKNVGIRDTPKLMRKDNLETVK
jgi:mRNA deadenylase 3'-5' endonuclease subunit Ccr4